MFEGLQMFGEALMGFLNPKIIFDVLWATQLGIIVGMLPGLTATMGVALMTTLTFKWLPVMRLLYWSACISAPYTEAAEAQFCLIFPEPRPMRQLR